MHILIERAASTDAAGILDYMRTIGGETDNLTFGEEGLPITVEAEADYIRQLENSRDSIMLVAKYNARIIGTASLNRLPRKMAHRGEFSVSILKEFWNQGVGSQLLSSILDFARKNAFEVIDLQVRSDNHAAIHLYEKHGFQKAGTHPAFFKIENEYVSFDYMYLTLL